MFCFTVCRTVCARTSYIYIIHCSPLLAVQEKGIADMRHILAALVLDTNVLFVRSLQIAFLSRTGSPINRLECRIVFTLCRSNDNASIS